MTVYLCDTNVWLSLVILRHEHHSTSLAWLGAIDEPGSLIFCRSTQQSFLRLLTTAAVFSRYGLRPLTNRESWATYEALTGDDRIVFRTGEPAGIEGEWRTFATRTTASPNLWMDAYLAAFAVAGGFRLVTTDAGFRQFRGLDLLLLGEK